MQRDVSVEKMLTSVCEALFPFRKPIQPDGYTDNEFDILLSLEKRWKDSLPHETFFQLLEIYPGAAPAARRAIKKSILHVKAQITALDAERSYVHEHVINKASFKQQRGLIEELNQHLAADLEEFEGEIKKFTFYLAHLDNLEEAQRLVAAGEPPVKKPTTGVTDLDIERARMMPIKSLVKVTPMKKTACLWHIDKHPSMHVYRDHAYCFVCNKRADSIDFTRELYHLDFVEAVKWLNNL